jgi:hypothetical protein
LLSVQAGFNWAPVRRKLLWVWTHTIGYFAGKSYQGVESDFSSETNVTGST